MRRSLNWNEALQSVADDELIEAGQAGGDAEQFGFVNSFARRAVVKRVEDDTAGAAFRETEAGLR